MVLSVSASQTVNLSFAERPACLPVSTTSNTSFDSRPSPRFTASSLSGAAVRFQGMAATVAKPWFSRPSDGTREDQVSSHDNVTEKTSHAGQETRKVGKGAWRGGVCGDGGMQWVGERKKK